jgi:hypothetical protein
MAKKKSEEMRPEDIRLSPDATRAAELASGLSSVINSKSDDFDYLSAVKEEPLVGPPEAEEMLASAETLLGDAEINAKILLIVIHRLARTVICNYKTNADLVEKLKKKNG